MRLEHVLYSTKYKSCKKLFKEDFSVYIWIWIWRKDGMIFVSLIIPDQHHILHVGQWNWKMYVNWQICCSYSRANKELQIVNCNTQSIKKKAFCTVLHIIVLLLHCITSQCRGGTPPDVRLSLPNKETTKGTDWDYGNDRGDDDDDIDDSEMTTTAKVTMILNLARKEIRDGCG